MTPVATKSARDKEGRASQEYDQRRQCRKQETRTEEFAIVPIQRIGKHLGTKESRSRASQRVTRVIERSAIITMRIAGNGHPLRNTFQSRSRT